MQSQYGYDGILSRIYYGPLHLLHIYRIKLLHINRVSLLQEYTLYIYIYIYLISSNSLQIVCWVRISDERCATERARVTT